MALHDTISKFVIKNYKEDCEKLKITPGYVYIQYGDDQHQTEYKLNFLRSVVYKSKKYKTSTFHPVSVDPVQSEYVNSFCTGIKLSKGKNQSFTYSDMTGVFKINFSDGTFMYLAKWLTGAGRNQKFETLFAGEKEVWVNFLKLVNKTKKVRLKPKNGIFKIDVVSNPVTGKKELAYTPLKNLAETPIIHPEITKVTSDIEFFYNNMPLFTRYKMPGTRKVMLVGEPGSGKSSFCIKLAKKMAATKSFVFATDINALSMHMLNCSKYKVSTIAVLEDAEQTLMGASSNLLNFLDGINQPTNKLGSYIIMTTNFPNAIEPRILKRPGRIDKIFNFNALENEYATDCLKIYLKDYITPKDEKVMYSKEGLSKLLKIVTGMTGAQIKSLVDASIAYTVSNSTNLSIDTIKATKEMMFNDLKEVYKMAKDTSLKGHEKSIGFSRPYEPVYKENYDIDIREVF